MTNKQLNLLNKPRIGRCAIFAFPGILLAFSSLAQSQQENQSSQVRLKALTDRVTFLEQKLFEVEKRLASYEASGISKSQKSMGTRDTPLDAGRTLFIHSSPYSDNTHDFTRKSSSNLMLARLPVAPKSLIQSEDGDDDPTNSTNHTTRFTAPFEVVDSNGAVIFEVLGTGGYRGIKVHALNGGFTQIGASSPGSYPNVSLHEAGKAASRIAMGLLQNGRPVFSILGPGGPTSELTEKAGGGELAFSNASGQVVSIIGSNPTNGEGHAIFTDTGGTPLLTLGAAGAHGDVLLAGPNKALAVWEMMLTGFH